MQRSGQDRVVSGIYLTIAAFFTFALQDATIKWLVAGLTVWQVLFVRSITIVVIATAMGRGAVWRRTFTSPARWRLMLRGLLLLCAWLSYYSAARTLPLAQLTTIYFGAPVLVTALSLPVLGERVPLQRWLAVGVGFAGVLLAAASGGTGGAIVPALLALLAAGLWGWSMLLIRLISRDETNLVQVLTSSLFFLVAGGVTMPWLWQTPPLRESLLLLMLGLFGAAGQFLIFEAIRRAPASVVAPFEYTSLVWAFVLGYVIWGDIPGLRVFAGGALIILSGLIVFVAERRRAARPVPVAAGSGVSRR
ncbi:MAG: DMT family transporter [Dongiaceae bacterium]